MGKQGKNKKRNRGSAKANARSIARKFAHASQQRHTENIISDEQYKHEQSAHRKVLAEKEKEVLSTTIFVTNVKDLNNRVNVEALNRFFARYGPIAACKATCFRTRSGSKKYCRFPPGQVRFVRKQDAEKIFGGEELLKVRKTVQLDCLFAAKYGKINVKPSMLHDEMIEEELRGAVVTVRADKLTLGHWCPHREEMQILGVHVDEKQNEWLEVFEGTVVPILAINLNKSTIELVSGDENMPEFVCLRFKQLALPLELCRDQATGAYSMIFAVK
jgi:RNA recognition motif-containing protein